MECLICLNEIQVASTQECGHVFCFTCIATWKADHETCPVCRKCILSPEEVIEKWMRTNSDLIRDAKQEIRQNGRHQCEYDHNIIIRSIKNLNIPSRFLISRIPEFIVYVPSTQSLVNLSFTHGNLRAMLFSPEHVTQEIFEHCSDPFEVYNNIQKYPQIHHRELGLLKNMIKTDQFSRISFSYDYFFPSNVVTMRTRFGEIVHIGPNWATETFCRFFRGQKVKRTQESRLFYEWLIQNMEERILISLKYCREIFETMCDDNLYSYWQFVPKTLKVDSSFTSKYIEKLTSVERQEINALKQSMFV